MEKKLDEIAENTTSYINVISDFYKDFHPNVVYLKENPISIKDKYNRDLGTHPTLGFKIIATMAMYGPIVKMFPSDNPKVKPIFGPIKPPLTLETITLQDAVAIFKYPIVLGTIGKTKVYLKNGQFGLYFQAGNDKFSAKDFKEPTLEDAIKLIEERKKSNLAEFTDDMRTYSVKTGPYGTYVKVTDKTGKKNSFNANIPKNEDINKLTLDRIKELITAYFANKKNRFKKTDNKKDNMLVDPNDKTQTGGVRKKITRGIKPETDNIIHKATTLRKDMLKHLNQFLKKLLIRPKKFEFINYLLKIVYYFVIDMDKDQEQNELTKIVEMNIEQERAQKSAQESSQEPARESSQEPAQESMQESSQEPARESSQEPAQESMQEPAQKSAEESAQESAWEPAQEWDKDLVQVLGMSIQQESQQESRPKNQCSYSNDKLFQYCVKKN